MRAARRPQIMRSLIVDPNAFGIFKPGQMIEKISGLLQIAPANDRNDAARLSSMYLGDSA